MEVFSGCQASDVTGHLKRSEILCGDKKEKSNTVERDGVQFSVGPKFQLHQEFCNASRVSCCFGCIPGYHMQTLLISGDKQPIVLRMVPLFRADKQSATYHTRDIKLSKSYGVFNGDHQFIAANIFKKELLIAFESSQNVPFKDKSMNRWVRFYPTAGIHHPDCFQSKLGRQSFCDKCAGNFEHARSLAGSTPVHGDDMIDSSSGARPRQSSFQNFGIVNSFYKV
mmetsp:Transcript_23490/g.50930  ORF Transcript_23490/g.50930 Transcript_23490/m.50930 type:complete len:225 (-) Transcript_23490:797-1471(-)